MTTDKRRKLRAYLSRRRIKNVKEWLLQAGITSPNELADFCDASLLSVDLDSYKQYFSSSSEAPAEERKDEKTSDQTWHIPAAERPLRKASKKKSAPKGKRKK